MCEMITQPGGSRLKLRDCFSCGCSDSAKSGFHRDMDEDGNCPDCGTPASDR